jgi:hypothetical protein
MIRSIATRRVPAVLLAMLAVCGLVLRGQVMPAPAGVAAIWGTLCHTGESDRHDPVHPATDCDSCLLCQALAGDHAATPVLPPCAVLHLQPSGASCPAALASAGTGPGRPQGAPRARAPPAGA